MYSLKDTSSWTLPVIESTAKRSRGALAHPAYKERHNTREFATAQESQPNKIQRTCLESTFFRDVCPIPNNVFELLLIFFFFPIPLTGTIQPFEYSFLHFILQFCPLGLDMEGFF